MPEKKPDQPDSREHEKTPGDVTPSGGGAAQGGSSSPATSGQEQPTPPEEVTTIPIGVPEDEQTFRKRKERARQPDPEEEEKRAWPDSEQEE